MKIKNRQQLLSHGDVESRRIVLDVAEKTLQKLDAGARIHSIMHMDGAILRIGDRSWDLRKKRNVFLLGAGKACNHMVMAVEDIMGDYLTSGIAIVKISEPTDTIRKTKIFVGGHPLPNEEGERGCREILRLVDAAGPEDLFILLMSGGSSALMSLPVDGISLQDEIAATDIMLKSGAGILEVNAVRRHISQMNGGRLAERIVGRGSEIIGFNISDSVEGSPTDDISVPVPDMSGTPMCPDRTTLADALEMISNRNLTDRMPESILHYLETCGPAGETPKKLDRTTYYMLNTLPDSCIYAKQAARELGIPSVVLTSFIEGEARETGYMLAAAARNIQTYHEPVRPPCLVITAGEAVTTILDNDVITGHGGPSQEMTLGFSIYAKKVPGVCLLSIDSEGTDGTTCAAGGITDSQTMKELEDRGIDPFSSLRGHASYEALCAADCAVVTGNTGTNVCDINIMYVPES